MKLFNFLGLVLALILLQTHEAYAYLDPGSGSYLLQVFLAVFLAASFTLKSYWRSALYFVQTRLFKKKSQ